MYNVMCVTDREEIQDRRVTINHRRANILK